MKNGGVLLPVFSLPGKGGIGTMGSEARRFIDFLVKAGQSCWQILPLGPTGYGDSPYQPLSAFGGNPLLIDLEDLYQQGLLSREELEKTALDGDSREVLYDSLLGSRYRLLYTAFGRSRWESAGLAAFQEQQKHWLQDYALFMAIKNVSGMRPWWEWPTELAQREPQALRRFADQHTADIHFWIWLQYIFYTQWGAVRSYANGRGIEIMGDIPIYVARDSAELWASPQLFLMDKDGIPTGQAGVPPDYFSADGQLWGNPLYNWPVHAKQQYSWWIDRLRNAFELVDSVRIDHFRGFEAYYSVPFGAENARNGHWEPGPGLKLFKAAQNALGDNLPIIAEDLGTLTPSARAMLAASGFPGMKVMQFGFDPKGDSEHLPHNMPEHCVAYIGTHDNSTVKGWLGTAPAEEAAFARKYLGLEPSRDPAWGFIKGLYDSPAQLVVVQMQDFLSLDDRARMNIPSTLGGNWCWRMLEGEASPQLAQKIRGLAESYGRANTKAPYRSISMEVPAE
ncbi:4-alpha-glucanotransferase [Oscillospiraceae bacterium MB08-C2-2]|nr:4-alpha-glucanotransferase [Oscillospiraceae bacterium MB08-C2-2]